ncbi:MAG: Cys-tRNA(Pro) deacylase [Actinobacteria bacterium]|nr:Cys-tRNA(Pro) deacylase [Actinomycetota bacterium]MBU1866696.1 Cys-tRNA(Pro) deacylase [Actinomycetota bacterium]
MSATRATTALDRAGIAYRTHRYAMAEAPAETYGQAVAAAIGFEADRVFKTLIAEVDGNAVVALVPVSRTLSLKALAAMRDGKRAAMADPAGAERLTGYVTGGISPFGQRTRLPVVLDDTALAWETICVSGGQRGLQLEVAPGDLAAHLGAFVAPISV